MFKLGDKVVCIDNNSYESYLTIGKQYVVMYAEHKNRREIIITNGSESVTSYYSKKFVSVIEFRKQKIEKICLTLGIK